MGAIRVAAKQVEGAKALAAQAKSTGPRNELAVESDFEMAARIQREELETEIRLQEQEAAQSQPRQVSRPQAPGAVPSSAFRRI